MSSRCAVCGNREVRAGRIIRTRKKLFCSMKCEMIGERNFITFYAIFFNVILFMPILVATIVIGFDFPALIAILFIFAIPSLLYTYWSVKGRIEFRKEQQEEFREQYFCVFCGDELEKPGDEGPIVCMSCGKKTPVCGMCNNRIIGKDELYSIAPCGHNFHKRELLDWLDTNKTCPQCGDIIIKVDIGIKN